MATCGVCIELISDNQRITCLTCQTNFHLKCAESMMKDGSIKNCARCKNVTLRSKDFVEKAESHKSVRSSMSGKTNKSTKSVRLELSLLQKGYELEKRQLEEKEELMRKKHEAEINFLQQQKILLQQIEENENGSISDDSHSKVQEWIHETNQVNNVQLANQCPIANMPTSTKIGSKYFAPIPEKCAAARKIIEKDLPTFTGKSVEWPFFYSVYESTTEACKFSNEENLSRLRNSLKGVAYESVKSYLMFPDLVPRVIDTLKKYFGQPEYIMNDIIKDIREAPGPKIEDAETVINYSMKIDNLCLAMKFSNLDPTSWNATVLYEVVHKLPPSLQYEWGSYKLKLESSQGNLAMILVIGYKKSQLCSLVF